MSLSPFDSFQSRFVTYLLNFPRITVFEQLTVLAHRCLKRVVYVNICTAYKKEGQTELICGSHSP